MSRKGWSAIVIAVVVCLLLGVLWTAGKASRTATPATVEAPAASPAADATGSAHALRFEPFSPYEVDQFLAKARKAETLKDFMQRCLAYPDPPHSHWNPEAIKAYCRYRNLATIDSKQVRALIEGGQSAELDRRLARALQAQLTQPEYQGLLDHIYQNAFHDGSMELRYLLDAWKKDSPESAFAFAASGMAYAAMASEARGTDYIQNTPPDAVLAMDRLTQQADADLRRALVLDPRLTPVYATMMRIGSMSIGRRYALDAQTAGFRVAPANFYLYDEAIGLAEPKWGGSLVELRAVRNQALLHAPQNPLLYLAATEASLSELDLYSCRCATPPELARVMAVLRDPATYTALASAADSADLGQQRGIAAVYYSEAIRFADRPNDRLSRAFELVPLGFPSWAHDDLAAVAPALPDRAAVYRGLAYADLQLEESTRAMSELEQAVRLDNTDGWSWDSLGWLYVDKAKWDEAWDAADQLIRLQPDDPDGWRLRAQVQIRQPRAGLAETVQTFTTRFGRREDQRDALERMREALAGAK